LFLRRLFIVFIDRLQKQTNERILFFDKYPHSNKTQIEKLLKVVNEDGAAGGDNLQFKPNPSALVGRSEGAEGEDEEGDGKYRPPKMLPTTMEQDEDGKEKSNKEKRREKEQRRRAQRSSLIKVRTILFILLVYFYFSSSRSSFSRTFAPGTCYLSGVLGLPKDAYSQTY